MAENSVHYGGPLPAPGPSSAFSGSPAPSSAEGSFARLLTFAILPVAKVLIMCALGLLMATQHIGILTADNRKILSKLVFNLFLPCLIFTQLGAAVSLEKIIEWWFIPTNVVLGAVLGCTMGWVVAKIVRPPPRFFNFTVVMIGIGNIGNVPLVLIGAICRDKHNPFGTPSTCNEAGVAYISFGQWVGALICYTFVFQMLEPPPAPLSSSPTLTSASCLSDKSDSQQQEQQQTQQHQQQQQQQQQVMQEQQELLLPKQEVHSGNENGSCLPLPPPESLPPPLLSLPPPDQADVSEQPLQQLQQQQEQQQQQPLLAPESSLSDESLTEAVRQPDAVEKGLTLQHHHHHHQSSLSREGSRERSRRGSSLTAVPGVATNECDGAGSGCRSGIATPAAAGSSSAAGHLPWVSRSATGSSGRTLDLKRDRRWWQAAAYKLLQELHIFDILQPPVVASLLALVLGCIPPVKRVLFGQDSPLLFVSDSLNVLGGAMVPCVMLVLGGNLIRGPGSSELGLRTTAAIVLVRLFAAPLIGILVVRTAKAYSLFPTSDLMFQFVLLLQHTMPTSILAGAVATLRGHGEKESSAILFWEHLAAIVTMAIWLLLYLNVFF